jgi:hypothetical protein
VHSPYDDLRPDWRPPAYIRLWGLRVVTCSGTPTLQKYKNFETMRQVHNLLLLTDSITGAQIVTLTEEEIAIELMTKALQIAD